MRIPRNGPEPTPRHRLGRLPRPRRFLLRRIHDATGVSGTGYVAEGVMFTDGSAVLRWRTRATSTAVYRSMADIEAIHGHDGDTRVVFIDIDD